MSYYIPGLIALILIIYLDNRIRAKRACARIIRSFTENSSVWQEIQEQIEQKKKIDLQRSGLFSPNALLFLIKPGEADPLTAYALTDKKDRLISAIHYRKLLEGLTTRQAVYSSNFESFSVYFTLGDSILWLYHPHYHNLSNRKIQLEPIDKHG